jgi:hypothetical protein
MKLIGRDFAWFRMVVLMWASVWMLLVPLVHVHPEMDHHHGGLEHVHSGTIHTVFAQDLDREFVRHQEHDRSAEAARFGIVPSAESSHGDQEYPEFGFSLVRDSSDRKSFKLLLSQIAIVTVGVVLVPKSRYSAERDSTSVSTFMLFVFDRPSRAPPSFFV